MVNRSIIAQNLTNLTDARYFAAWGVAYMSFCLDPDSPYNISVEDALEIKEWVEGPKILTESMSIEFLDWTDGHILDNIYSSLPLNKEVFYRISIEEVLKGLPQGNYIVAPNGSELEKLKTNKSKFADANLYVDIKQLDIDGYDSWPGWGLVVQGGAEEKVGVKSYSELDELYEKIMDDQYL